MHSQYACELDTIATAASVTAAAGLCKKKSSRNTDCIRDNENRVERNVLKQVHRQVFLHPSLDKSIYGALPLLQR